jgi:hypothetical protein
LAPGNAEGALRPVESAGAGLFHVRLLGAIFAFNGLGMEVAMIIGTSKAKMNR